MQATITQTNQKLSLFAQGYRIRAARTANELLIRKPDAQTIYTINPVRNCCTCPAGHKGIPCKHLREARVLVMEQWAQVLRNATPAQETRYESEMYLLMLRWEEVQAAKSAARR